MKIIILTFKKDIEIFVFISYYDMEIEQVNLSYHEKHKDPMKRIT